MIWTIIEIKEIWNIMNILINIGICNQVQEICIREIVIMIIDIIIIL